MRPLARLGDCGVSRLDRIRAAQEASKKESFHPLDLNEGNVQAIFNRCVSKDYSSEKLWSDIWLPTERTDLRTIFFVKDIVLKNKKSIQYLFGQLSAVHERKTHLTINEVSQTYTSSQWTTQQSHLQPNEQSPLMKFLYLARCGEISCILPFSKTTGDAAIIDTKIKPTLSPKDPNFPAWWEAHKGEWED